MFYKLVLELINIKASEQKASSSVQTVVLVNFPMKACKVRNY